MQLLILALGAVLALALWGVFGGSHVDWHMSIHGWIALIGGVILTCALGGGLMALSFYSDRRGYDDRANEASPDKDDASGGEHR